ncbi:type I-E CRISPR-associated protein Cse2/CasB [Kerstersia gyiorum]|uniref:type I-E CRISPR-associated protein Cse2/CasB n=1 Tax=Kerstersia gyiorum TaxID=206506 RepID=UPI00209E0E0C|nr:type I-E CRISPR-associated protein Cse2/CasB [Kerstersia gyiorum]MCP1633769.1 CRISPR system Cascade subunit CasB [Kerstersia gyiorum]MCP1637486.1 CRISPR system Cascade subunit CasB [Kerstersia gyiorum]MCP1671634.1 CRISPR system Cascade subunit CasB [Kerstersia gyiorum]MCP1679472.1 CRISPR system Cascade subunit CasB [Kerstersia gyiorum]MCP1683087.1 CRISPR system Cascade subunit CasB [Kerstersia gyiorum]
MSEHAERFIENLKALRERDAGAIAVLRHSLTFEPGAYPRAFPYVERFVGAERSARNVWRLALYAVAGLFARHPEQQNRSFAAAFGELLRKRESPSIEKRFIALLEADADNILDYLRQAISLLAADDIGLDYVRLLDDLAVWMNPHADRDRLRQHWARDFYRAAEFNTESDIAS